MLLEESARLLEPNHKPEFLINARENDGPPAPVGSIVPEGSLLQHWLLRQIFSTLLYLANHAEFIIVLVMQLGRPRSCGA